MTRKPTAEAEAAAAAAAESGKTIRACDCCISKRARWYCAADDAFLCQLCDASVHSANSLARRHDRVRLQTASFRPSVASWHHGFTRKARTPRHAKTMPFRNPFSQVPELISAKEETSQTEEGEEDHLLLHRVPVLGMEEDDQKEDLNGFLSFVMDPAEFAADVECLLLDNECFDIEELGLGSSKDDSINSDKSIKIENGEFEMEEKLEIGEDKKKALLSLDREAVVIAWGSRGTPWTSGDRPNLDLDFDWSDFMGTWWGDYRRPAGEIGAGMSRQPVAGAEGEREARVSRYREKRRTRLFAKKIRYEVRKLNAEKRPRMKGRFVKRSACFGTPPFATV